MEASVSSWQELVESQPYAVFYSIDYWLISSPILEEIQSITQTQYQNRPLATSVRDTFGPLQSATRVDQLTNRVKVHEMVQHILQPCRADVVRREDVIEQPSDPRPNAFFE